MLVLIWFAVVITALWLYLRQVYSKFERKGVKNITPVPVLGNMTLITLKMEHFSESIDKLYNRFPNERFVGRYEFMNPMLMIRDIELVKKITVKDFEHFLDHRSFVALDPLFGRNLFALKGQEWKDMRSTLSPAFTSSKIRLMVPFMVEVGDQMIKSIRKKIGNSKDGYVDLDCKDLTTRYANDVIASCAFGLKVDSHTDENNSFYAMGKEAATFKFKQLLVFFMAAAFPRLLKLLKLKMFSEESKNFFRDLVLTTMKERELHNIVRPDMIHLLMEAKKGKLSHDEKTKETDLDAGFATVEESAVGKKNIDRVWSEDDLIAQAVIFFVAGFETVSVAMSFLLYEIALNPEIQERLVEEIKENDRKNNGKFDYNSILNMTYMDMVVSETLRKWPAAIATDRVCIKDYNIGKPNDKASEDYIVREGVGIMIPVWSFHRSPEYYPDPDKFDPERFSSENKHNIQPFTYLPFGVGPRNCIGSRFALCEVKVMTYQLLQHLVITPCEKTSIPAELCRDNFNLRIKGGHWLRFKLRD